MSSRLKRKLGELGVDTASARANESFCLIGTPLPPLEKSKDNGEFVPLWKQDIAQVRDEKGRRRLHGAFTGGFSAGYFNSVGSKEGWTPSTFVSSRNERVKQKGARPEDFMDDEDLQDLKDSRNLVDTADEMDLTGGTKSDLAHRGVEDLEQDNLASTLEASMLPAPKDSAGAHILKKMGWRLGQGIGPRVTLRERRLQDMQAYPGQKLSGDDLNIPDDDEEANKHTYAPRDTPLLLVERKDNSHGLGYSPGMGLNETLGVKSGGVSSGPNVSAGFGLGALNDADEDDLDIYDSGFTHSRNRTAYDHIDREEDDKIAIGSRAERKVAKTRAEVRPAASLATFSNGTPVLAGFVLSDKPVAEDLWFPMPDVPKGWTPDPRRVWDKDHNKENIQKPQPTAPGKWKSTITADERGDILGETPLPSAPRSVFDYMSQKDRERLKNIATGGAPPGQGPNASILPGSAPSLPPATITISRTEPHIAHAALKGFQPFTSDPVKQARYTAYLQSQASSDSSVPSVKPLPGQTIEGFNKEVEDYAKAATIFKPISGAMAGRFTSAAVVDHGPKIHEGLHTPSPEEMAEKEAEERKREEENISPKAHAARMGMYGPMTREVKPWQPAKLLCKRFGVKDPNPPPEETSDVSQQQPTASGSGAASTSGQQEKQFTEESFGIGKTHKGPRDPSNIGLGEDDDQGRDTLTYQRPAMDVFKAIFASDDEDSGDDEDTKEEEDGDEVPEDVPKTTSPHVPTNEAPMEANITIVQDEPIDLATFKPTFIPRESKSKKSKEKDRGKDKKNKKKSTLVSFEIDEDGGEHLSVKPSKDRPKKKRRKEKEKEKREDDDDGMWVEKPAPEVVRDLVLNPLVEPPPSDPAVDGNGEMPAATRNGRKRAIDFM